MKRALLIIALLIVFFDAAPCAYAHPGRTDSAGGHHDRSTGEYHYHHGYSAHQHSDIDGDGIADCPYEFDDKTDHSYSGSVSKHSTAVSAPKSTPSSHMTADLQLQDKVVEKKQPIVFYIVVGIAVCALLIIIRIDKINCEAEERRMVAEKRRQERLRQEEEQKRIEAIRQQELFQKEKEKYTALYENHSTAEASGADDSCYIGIASLPASHIGVGKWGEAFTFYVTRNGKCYHKAGCRHLNFADTIERNAYEIAYPHLLYGSHRKYCPCSYCNPVLPDMSWVKKYKEIKTIREKYDIPEP